MKVWVLLLLLALLPGISAQNGTDNGTENGTDDTDLPGADPDDAFDLRLAISGAAVVFLVVAFVYLARR